MKTEMALAYYPLHALAYAMLPALVHVPIDGDRQSGLCSPPSRRMTLVWMHGSMDVSSHGCAQQHRCDVCTRSCTHLVLGYALRHAGQRLLDVVQPAGATHVVAHSFGPRLTLERINHANAHTGARDDQGFHSGPSMSVLPTCTTHPEGPHRLARAAALSCCRFR